MQMQPSLCSRCKKNIAIIFITKIENGESKQEGLCVKCANELGIKPVQDLMKKLGISGEELEQASMDMMNMLAAESDDDEDDQGSDDPENGKTTTFPFLNRLFGANGGAPGMPGNGNGAPGNGNGNGNPGVPQPGMGFPPQGFQPPQGEKKRERRDTKRKFLDTYCISLTEKAKNGKIDRIVGRDTEIERTIQILNRRQKNNPCLIGEPGVGKTAIAEGLAQRIVDGNVPEKLRSKEVYMLDLTGLVAGTQFRGQFESRMKGLIDEIKKLGNIILVIDEVHNIASAGDAEGSMNAANILKPALSRGEIQVVGATTFAEYRKHIEKDSALERRFQPVTVNEPSIEESVEIIKGVAHYYEEYHSVRISERVARQAVLLSERYITDRFLPDKAIDLIDEACSDVNLKSEVIIRRDLLKKELQEVVNARAAITESTDEDYEKLATLRSRELQLSERLKEAESELPELTVENLARVIELWTKIPASSIQEAEFERLRGLADRLKSRIIGQDEAVDTVAAAIRRGRVGISEKRKPVSFIFVGPTGVGKTELVKTLAQDLFDSPEALIRLDMSEFMEKHAVSRIIGAPPGYVGYDEAGQLTEKIRRKPYSVILFDEIEKAHPDVLNIMLQILDDGRITDAQGRVVNFENTVIIMTSNAGSERKGSGTVGFDRGNNSAARENAMKALSDIMRPEFINRVDEVVVFNQLSEEDFNKIVGIMLGDLKKALANKLITLTWNADVESYLVKKSYSQKYGARNLRRVIQKEIEDTIASAIIDNYERDISLLVLSLDGDKIVVSAM